MQAGCLNTAYVANTPSLNKQIAKKTNLLAENIWQTIGLGAHGS